MVPVPPASAFCNEPGEPLTTAVVVPLYTLLAGTDSPLIVNALAVMVWVRPVCCVTV